MAITWKNISGPDFTGAQQGLAAAGKGIASMFQGFGNMAEDQNQRQVDAENLEITQNTQQALESIKGLKSIEQYQNTSLDELVGKFGQKVNRAQVFNAFDSRDEDIYEEQDILQARALKNDINATNAEVETYLSQGLLGGKTQEELKDGLDAVLEGKPIQVRDAARKQFLAGLEYESKLTPEGQAVYDAGLQNISLKTDLELSTINENIAANEAIIAQNPKKNINDLDRELSLTDYVNKVAPDQFELDWAKYEGDEIEELVTEARSDPDLLARVKQRIGGKDMKGYTIPEDVLAHVIKTAPVTTDNKLRLDNFEDEVVRIAAQYHAYGIQAGAAKAANQKLNATKTGIAQKQNSEVLALRKRVQNMKTARNNLTGR